MGLAPTSRRVKKGGIKTGFTAPYRARGASVNTPEAPDALLRIRSIVLRRRAEPRAAGAALRDSFVQKCQRHKATAGDRITPESARKMLLFECAACRRPLALDAQGCGRCRTRYLHLFGSASWEVETPIASLRPTLWFAPCPSSGERLGGPPQEHPKRGI